MLPTLDTEDEEDVQYGLCFLVNYNEDGILVDSALDVNYALNKTWVGALAAARSLAAAMTILSLWARFVNTGSPGPYLVKTSFPLSRDDLEKYLRSLDKAALKSFLQGSKI